MRNLTKTICVFLLLSPMVLAVDHHVPGWYDNIQAAVDDCSDGDTVVIAQGTYTNTTPGNYNINMQGKEITIRSENPDDPAVVAATIINFGNRQGFVFRSGENSDSQICGLTITGGNNFTGGAIRCMINSSPVISKCVITGNTAIFGGAIASESGADPVITNCTITNNSAIVSGGGIYCLGGNATVNNCVITANTSPRGAAIGCSGQNSSISVNGSTIRDNTASNSGGGIYCANSAELTLKHTILWGNTATYGYGDQIYTNGGCKSNIAHCDIQGGKDEIYTTATSILNWGGGNIDADPLFAGESDYHLAAGSICIDAGDAGYIAAEGETDIDGQKRISGQMIDMGADETKAAVIAEIRVTPRSINLKGRTAQINCRITLESDDYDAGDIDIDSIMINGETETLASHLCQEGDTLMVRLFLTTDEGIKDYITDNTIELSVTGSFNDDSEATFAGSDTVKVLTYNEKQLSKGK
jgi:parallel beta-helix repeat protein/predicted outer membrane repeat protein